MRPVRHSIAFFAVLVAADGVAARAPDDEADGGAPPEVPAATEEAAPEEMKTGTIRQRIASADDILQDLRTSSLDRDGLFKFGPISVAHPPWQELNKQLDEDIGLRLGFTYYLLYQWASSADGPSNAGAGDFDFFGRWALVEGDDGLLGMLGFNLEHRHRYTTIPPSDLDTSVGSIWPTTRGFTDSGFSFNELWWDQQFRDDRISFRVGTINQKHFYDLYRFKSQKRYFLSGPLSDSPTIDFPRNGFGGVLRVSPSEELHVIAGIGDVNGERRVGSIDTFFSDREYFTALDFSFTPTFDTLGEGRYSVTFWHTDASASQGTPSGDGFAALVEQEVGEGVIPFARYGYGDGANLPIRHLVALGVGVEAPFGQRDDVAGLGGSWSRPRDGSLRDQWGLEAFYRVQLTAVFQVTPGVQLIANPSLRPGTDFLTILQLRVGLVF